MTERYTTADFERDLGEPYAWPGGYPRYFVTADGAALSFKAASDSRISIIEALLYSDPSGCWTVAGCEVNWEDEDLSCDHTGEPIPSAYGEG